MHKSGQIKEEQKIYKNQIMGSNGNNYPFYFVALKVFGQATFPFRQMLGINTDAASSA